MQKLEKASENLNIKEIAIAGGVSANSELRNAIYLRENKLGWKTYIPNFEFCTHNAAMIGIAAYYKYQAQEFTDISVVPEARMKL